MELHIETIYANGSGDIGVSSHEPDNNFYTYRLNEESISDGQSVPNSSSFYPFLLPEQESPPSITTVNVDEFGVKNSIGWGAGAYYHPTDSEYSYVVLPLHNQARLSTPPEATISVSGGVVIFDISSTNYECVRMVAGQGNTRIEQVEYFKNGVVHYEMSVDYTGDITCWVQAYSKEINVVSEVVVFEANITI